MNYMKLFPEPFSKIKSGEKNIEFRLNDEKRKRVKIGDCITFKNTETEEELVTECIALHHAKSFLELFESLYVNSGLDRNREMSPREMAATMRTYYSLENEQKYGVLGIEISVL